MDDRRADAGSGGGKEWSIFEANECEQSSLIPHINWDFEIAKRKNYMMNSNILPIIIELNKQIKGKNM